eukprot:15421627-Alexandrium_andersonii.AAC.1
MGLSDEDLARLMAGLASAGPSMDEMAGKTGPPPSAASSRAATPRYQAPLMRITREPTDRSEVGGADSFLALSARIGERRAKDVTNILLHNNAYQATVALCSFALFGEGREEGD